MTKIYKDANENHIACVKLYANSGKVSNDAHGRDQVYTSDLRSAFKNGLIIDIGEPNSLYKALEYSENNGVGSIGFVVEGQHPGKNKYKFPIDTEYDYVTIKGGDTAAEKTVNPSRGTIGARQMSQTGMAFGLEFGSQTAVYSTLSSLGDVEKTISFRINISGAGAPGANKQTLVISAEGDSKSIEYAYTYEGRVSLTTTNNILKIELLDTAWTSFDIQDFQIELGPTATDYEPYKLVDGWDIESAVSRPDPS